MCGGDDTGQEWMNISESDAMSMYLKVGLWKNKSTMRKIQLSTGLETEAHGLTVYFEGGTAEIKCCREGEQHHYGKMLKICKKEPQKYERRDNHS